MTAAMATPSTKLTIQCDRAHQKFTLRHFPTSLEAFKYAATLIRTETKVIVYTSHKKVLLETSIYPVQV